MEHWTEKDVLEYARLLKSPFEEKPEGKGVIPNLLKEIKEFVKRNKGV